MVPFGKSSKFGKITSSNYNKSIQDLIEKQYGNTVQKILPTEYNLFQNYPNPFNPVTTLQYDVTMTSMVTMKVYDFIGREVANLVNENKEQADIWFDLMLQNFQAVFTSTK